jgi:hypothetical protein
VEPSATGGFRYVRALDTDAHADFSTLPCGPPANHEQKLTLASEVIEQALLKLHVRSEFDVGAAIQPCGDSGQKVELITGGYVNLNSSASECDGGHGPIGSRHDGIPDRIRRLAIRLGGAVAVMSMPCAGVTQFIVATPKSAALEGSHRCGRDPTRPVLYELRDRCRARYKGRVSFPRSGTVRPLSNCSTPSIPPRTPHW